MMTSCSVLQAYLPLVHFLIEAQKSVFLDIFLFLGQSTHKCKKKPFLSFSRLLRAFICILYPPNTFGLVKVVIYCCHDWAVWQVIFLIKCGRIRNGKSGRTNNDCTGGFIVSFGVFLIAKHKKITGWVFSILGLGLSAVPFLVSYYLSKWMLWRMKAGHGEQIELKDVVLLIFIYSFADTT